MKKPLALIDLDGTLVDFSGTMRRDMLALSSPEERLKLEDLMLVDVDVAYHTPYLKARMDLIKRQPNWWYNLEKLPDGFKVVGWLRELGYRLNILTRGPKRISEVWEQKARWSRENVPDADISIVSDKALHYGRVLVDDWVDYVVPWLKNRPNGLVIMPAQEWNKGFSHPQVVRHTSTNDNEVYEALKQQAGR